MSEFYTSLSHLRQSQPISEDVVKRARDHCKGGRVVRNLTELHAWMVEQNPQTPYFDNHIASGHYPVALAAFVTSCSWEDWKKHAVYALHGEIYLQRLAAAKALMPPDAYRDHVAGASMHKANGYCHMASCAHNAGLKEIRLPTWDGPLELSLISAQAVTDLRRACTLRSEKYSQKHTSENTVKAYQAALRNLADALEIHSVVSGKGAADAGRMAVWLRERATNLALTQQQLLVACASGQILDAADERSVARDLRLAETAAGIVTRKLEPEPLRPNAGSEPVACARCGQSEATHLGFTCRCLCLCANCAQTSRVIECPNCNDFTEFVQR